MDQHAIQRSLDEGFAVYYSRSRQEYWRKGDTSGHVQELVSMSFDCDGDSALKVRKPVRMPYRSPYMLLF